MNKKTFIYLLEGAAVSAVSTAIMILLFVKGYGDFCHPESAAFLQLYTEKGKSLLQIIFNPWYTDWGCYQARELSYFFDWCDAQFIKACISEGHTHFSVWSMRCSLLQQLWCFISDFSTGCRNSNGRELRC